MAAAVRPLDGFATRDERLPYLSIKVDSIGDDDDFRILDRRF